MALKAAIVPVTLFQQNCTLLFDETTKSGVVIDPGGDLDRIEAAIAETGIKVEGIWLTHGHIDHAAAADELREKLGVTITGPHPADKPLLDTLVAQGQKYGIAGVRNVTPDRWLAEGETATVAGVPFQIYHVPGHSPGSVVFVNLEQGLAIVGDVIFQGSIGRTDLPFGDAPALISGIRNKLLPLGDDIVFICGHGPASTFGDERRTNPYVGEGAP